MIDSKLTMLHKIFSSSLDKYNNPPPYWRDALESNIFYQNWLLSSKKISFWLWLEKKHPVIFSSSKMQQLRSLKEIRKNYLKSIIRKAGKLNRSITKVGMHESYWLEYMDPRHHNIITLQELFSVWFSLTTNKLNFWQWLEYKGFDKFSNVTKYLSINSVSQYRLSYDLEQGLIYRGHETFPFDTSNIEKDFQPLDKVAFVMDHNYNLYAAEKYGAFHHSSFLSGNPVIAAGMIKIIDGKIQEIDDSSGHYKVLPIHIANALSKIPKEVFADGCLVITKKLEKSGRSNTKVIRHVFAQTAGKPQVELLNDFIRLLTNVLQRNNTYKEFLYFTKIISLSEHQLIDFQTMLENIRISQNNYLLNSSNINLKILLDQSHALIQKLKIFYIQACHALTLEQIIYIENTHAISIMLDTLKYMLMWFFINSHSTTKSLQDKKNKILEKIHIFELYCNSLLHAITDLHPKEALEKATTTRLLTQAYQPVASISKCQLAVSDSSPSYQLQKV